MRGHRALGNGAEQREPVVQAGRDLAEPEHPGAGRGQLDRQWEAVESLADPLGVFELVLLGCPSWTDGLHAVDQ
ncbi:hypothetical protein [Actinocrispum sp. NPDC049592]|uniref:hypothetical protein n=1 Tax=Actinocrispum sp. NPDC049592 TaxID=3154835 RepID=UPI0034217C2E